MAAEERVVSLTTCSKRKLIALPMGSVSAASLPSLQYSSASTPAEMKGHLRAAAAHTARVSESVCVCPGVSRLGGRASKRRGCVLGRLAAHAAESEAMT